MAAVENMEVMPRALGERSIQELVSSCNKDGMDSLRNGQDKAAFEQFKYAEAILLANNMNEDNTALLAVTCNNLGCYYKKVGKFHGALSYLRRALKMEAELNTDEVTLAGTHLNLCAILSKLEKHTKAVQHALCALELMSNIVAASSSATVEEYTVLAVSYHNVGMEREFLGQWDQAATAFQHGYQVAKRLLGDNHPLARALQKNCEAVIERMQQAQLAKPKTRHQRTKDTSLPPVTPRGQMTPRGQSTIVEEDPSRLSARANIRQEALDWIKSEEAQWQTFAQKTLGESAVVSLDSDVGPAGRMPSMAATRDMQAIRDLQGSGAGAHEMPEATNMGAFKFTHSRSPTSYLKKTQMAQALDSNPEALMEIIEADMDGPSMKAAPNDLRPNRSMKKSTRTSRIVRRTGIHNSTAHRDRVEEELKKKEANRVPTWRSAQAQNVAATRIQRVWRAWSKYCHENSEWMTVTWICATMIQSHWRSYHVRRIKADSNASTIQRHCRGFLVRSVIRNHTAAVAIQRRVVGMLTRKRLKELTDAARTVQRVQRGRIHRQQAAELRRFKEAVAITLQRHIRAWYGRRLAEQVAKARRDEERLNAAALDLQKMFRGHKGRQRAEARREEIRRAVILYEAATRLQCNFRVRKSRGLIDGLRKNRLKEMEKAATIVRKVYVGMRTKKMYKAMLEEFSAKEETIIMIQRCVRGCMTRLKLWRDAVRTEEVLWAAIEIQRCWRGYCGRVAWEDAYEEHWRREMAAAAIARNMRGWHGRLQVSRTRRKIARVEFENARRRFRAAQKIQALARGVNTRKVTDPRRRVAKWAATTIQRRARGHRQRAQMWDQVANQKATMITAMVRGYLVRRRLLQLFVRVVYIQRAYRDWLKNHKDARDIHFKRKQLRKEAAGKIQRHWRQCLERREIGRIQAAMM